MDRDKVYSFYNNKQYDKFLDAFEEYLKNGYGIEDTLIGCYIHALIATQKFDKAYKILKALEKDVEKFDSYEALAGLYVKCYKPKEAERLFTMKKTPIHDYLNLIKIKLLEGEIKEAQEILNSWLKIETDPGMLKRLRSYEQIINNHLEKGAYIESEYECFKEKGNFLEPGHIVYLKNNPKSENRIEDPKILKRPYMIWKIEEGIIYIFPVSTQEREKTYKLYKQKYPNSIGDRIIKYSLYYAKEEDILSVQDKVLDRDFEIILDNLYQASYFSTKESKKQNKYFMQEYIGEIQKYDVIKEITQGTVIRNNYHLVLDVEEDHYRTIEIDYKNRKIIGVKSEKYSKKRLIYDVIKPNEEAKEELIKGLSELVTSKSLVGKKVIANNVRYIVVEEDKENYLCIDEIYSPSYINVEAVNKDDIRTITGEVSEEELDKIKNLISLSGYNIKKCLKRARKK